jgi:ubiquitin-protein ligase
MSSTNPNSPTQALRIQFIDILGRLHLIQPSTHSSSAIQELAFLGLGAFRLRFYLFGSFAGLISTPNGPDPTQIKDDVALDEAAACLVEISQKLELLESGKNGLSTEQHIDTGSATRFVQGHATTKREWSEDQFQQLCELLNSYMDCRELRRYMKGRQSPEYFVTSLDQFQTQVFYIEVIMDRLESVILVLKEEDLRHEQALRRFVRSLDPDNEDSGIVKVLSEILLIDWDDTSVTSASPPDSADRTITLTNSNSKTAPNHPRAELLSKFHALPVPDWGKWRSSDKDAKRYEQLMAESRNIQSRSKKPSSWYHMFMVDGKPRLQVVRMMINDDPALEGGVFYILLSMSSLYPMEMPLAIVLTKMHHPNIGSDGILRFRDLDKKWNSMSRLHTFIAFIAGLIGNPYMQDQELLNADVAFQFVFAKDEYEKQVREYTDGYASMSQAPPTGSEIIAGHAILKRIRKTARAKRLVETTASRKLVDNRKELLSSPEPEEQVESISPYHRSLN